MIKHFLTLIFSCFFWLFSFSQSLVQVWSTPKVLEVPESAYFDASTNKIYVSNIAGSPAEKNGKGFISTVDQEGKVIQLHWIDGLNAPKGITVFNDILYVTDIDEVVLIDLKKEKIIGNIAIPSALFLNDITHDTEGTLYISDTQTNTLFRIKNGKPEKWLKDLQKVNGMAFANGKIFCGTFHGILELDPYTKAQHYVVHHQGLIDGLIPYKTGFIISNWEGKIEWITPTQNKILQDLSVKHIYAADLGFIPSKRLIIIPTFYDNRLIAMELKY